MHIAVCDDNGADRKQIERLLSRESEQRKNDTGVFYVNSFGNSEVLSKSPMQYNLFFIDMTAGDTNGYEFALQLIKSGVTAPIVLCVSAIDYRELHRRSLNPPANLAFLDKPIKTAALHALLDQMIILEAERPPMIELRTEKETHYLTETDIISGCVNGYFVDVTLADGRVIRIADSMINVYEQIMAYSSYVAITKKAFINVDYINKCSLLKVTLTNGSVWNISPDMSSQLKKYYSAQLRSCEQ